MNRRIAFTVFLLSAVLFAEYVYGRSDLSLSPIPFQTTRSVADVLRTIGPRAESRLRPYFEQAGVSYPPSHVTLIGLKDELELEVWAEQGGRWVHLHTYDVLAASGDSGPKQRTGDRQVPEGIYHVTSLNPNSRYHLSMRINYPNEYDIQKARDDRRTRLGGDIYIHGKAKSIGCIAVGDPAIEELFVLVAKTGIENVKVLIAPKDLRKSKTGPEVKSQPAWVNELYNTIGQEMSKFRTGQGA